MRCRSVWSLLASKGALTAVIVAAPLMIVNASGQTARPAGPAKQYVPPRTSWGDPDLQGWFTNLSEDGTPLERPDRFAGRRLEDIKGEELAAIKREPSSAPSPISPDLFTLPSIGGRTISTL